MSTFVLVPSNLYYIFIFLEELRTEMYTSVHNLYSRSSITNLVVRYGMLLDRMLYQYV